MKLKKALRTIIDHADKTTAVNYTAVNYAKQALYELRTGEFDARSTILYCRSNLSHWRGPIAKEVRATLDAYLENEPDDNDKTCPYCRGTGIGLQSPDSHCTHCGGHGVII